MSDAPSFELWTSARQKLYKDIETVESSLAPLYREAVRMIDTPSAPGEERMRLAIIGHCIRELINNLPEALADVPGALRGGLNDDSALSNFDKAVAKWAGRLDSDPAGMAATAPNATVEVPGHVVAAVEQLAASRRSGTARRISRDSLAILGHVDLTSPVLGTWGIARDFFMNSTHLDRQYKLRDVADRLPDQWEVLRHLELIEATLHVRLGAFFDSLHSIEDLLAEANSQSEPSHAYRAPDADFVNRVLARLGTLQLRRAFFTRLDNPLWIMPLHEQGLFSNPPTIQTLDDGHRTVDPWPQLDYLVRIAAEDPITVADVLHPIADVDNPWLRRGIAEVMVAAPTEVASRFATTIAGWRNDGKAELVRSSDLVRLIEMLCEAGLPEGPKLAEAYYRPYAKSAHPGMGEPLIGLNAYEHGATLPRVARALGAQAPKRLLHWVEDYQRMSVAYQLAPGTDDSPVWRPRVARRAGLGNHPIGDALVDELRDASHEQAMRDPLDAVTLLLSGRQPLIQRVALDVIAAILESTDNTVQPVGFTVPFSYLAETAETLLQSRYLDKPYRTEFFRFAAALASREPEFFKEHFNSALVEAERAATENYRLSLVDAGVPAWDAQGRSTVFADRWTHGLLSGIDPKYLPPSLADRLKALDIAFGVIDQPTQPAFELTPMSGPSSPLSHEEMEVMSDQDLLKHLHSWHPDPDAWFGPTHHGQNLELAVAIQAAPGRFVHDLGSLQGLRPIYLRGIFEGWQKSMAEGHAVDPEDLVAALAWAAGLDDDYVVDVEGDEHEDDASYRHLKFQTVQLVHTLLEFAGSGSVKLTPAQWPVVESLLEILCVNPDPGPSSNDQIETGEMDALDASFTTIRPQAIRNLIVLAAITPVPEVRAAVFSFLTERMSLDDSLATAAAFGEGLGRLAAASPEWAGSHLQFLFDSSRHGAIWQRTALIAALSTHQVAPKTLELLYQPMLDALEQGASATPVEERLESLIGRWAALGYVIGTINLGDRLVRTFFEQATIARRREAIGHLGWLLMRSQDVSNDCLKRTMSLVDWRIDYVRSNQSDHSELDDFHWYVQAEQLPSSWWASRLATVCEVSRSFVSKGMIGQRIAGASRNHPDETLTSLELLLGARSADQPLNWDLTENAAPEVIAACLDTHDLELSDRATKLMNALGSMGLLDIENRVQGHRQSL